MLGQTDWAGIAAVIAAVFSGVATVIGAMNHRRVSDVQTKLDTNGDPRTVAQIVTDIAHSQGTDKRAGEQT